MMERFCGECGVSVALFRGGIAMVKGGHRRLQIWWRKWVNYRGVKKQSDYRAVNKAQRLNYFGGVETTLAGNPLHRGEP